MTTRRHFIQGMAALAPGLTLGQSIGANPDPSRLALVIGNSTYRDAPLVNPVNDAHAMTNLLGQAGFTVSSQFNVQRVAMMAAFEKFAADVRKPETKLVMFYYAGHGAQLDWRNYLLPVDAKADSAALLRQTCIDLNELLGQLGKSKDKTFIIMLDACRNNPFGSSYQPEQKGLSQFDAPVGSLLAYATAPGNVASDGSGQNGLYTENLVRELSVRGVRIEDALKRVRLNVRLASRGAQIPWETTSLEDDVFIFSNGKKKLTEEEQEQLLESDLHEWARIKLSRNVDDWVSYLRNFPNGRFAEIAQMRLTRLLTPVPKPETVSTALKTPATSPPAASAAKQQPVVAPCAAPAGELARNLVVGDNCAALVPAPVLPVPAAAVAPLVSITPESTPAQVAPPKPMSAPASVSPPETAAQQDAMQAVAQSEPATPAIEQSPNQSLPLKLQVSVNPFSAGRYPLGRKYSIGDMVIYRNSDLLSNVELKPTTLEVTGIDLDSDHIELNNGKFIIDSMGNYLRTPRGGDSDVPQQFNPTELQIGHAWTAGWKQSDRRGDQTVSINLRIDAFEKVRVPAGEFMAFRIEIRGWQQQRTQRTQIGYFRREQRIWVVPGINFAIKDELLVRNPSGRLNRTDRMELVSLHQQTVDMS